MKKGSRKKPQPKKKIPSFLRPVVACDSTFGEQRCHNLCELTHDMLQLFKAEGTVLEVNPVWRQTLEYSDEDLSHLTVFNIIHPKDKKESEEIFLAVLRDGKPRKFRALLLAKSGREVVVEGTVSRILSGERPCALSGIFHDVTRYHHYEQLKDEFISTVSHELRTPLTVIREGVSQIRDGLLGSVPDDQKNLLDMVLQNSDRLGRIIAELLDVSKLEAGKVRLHRKLCDIAELVNEVIANFRVIVQQKGLEVLTDFPAEKIEIYIDREKIAQVLTNLINNSLKFTEKGHIRVHLRTRAGFVECQILDTGKGISKEDLPKAFQKFRQFERDVGPGDRGTGLGLSICKKIIELHYGRIQIKSSPLEGTAVTFALPQFTHRDLFKDAIAQAMRRCEEDQSPLSIIIFDILDFDVLEKELGAKPTEQLILKLEQILNASLRRVGDVAIKEAKAIMVLLPETRKENAFFVMGRLSQVLEDFLLREQETPKVEIHSSVVCYPEEAKTLEEILDRIFA